MKAIVTTTINEPTEALVKFAGMKDWELVVVLDRKEPKQRLAGVHYLTPGDQEKIDLDLSGLIGWNCIQRRNFGFIYAYRELGATIVATVDDDNIPQDRWGEDLLVGRTCEAEFFDERLPAFDPLGKTQYPHLWHRGYPLQLVGLRRDYFPPVLGVGRFDIQADGVNGDPDIDAVCRMIHRPNCEFTAFKRPMAANKPSPFNSQNTFLTRKVLPEYFCFPGIGRMDDIWASYHVQALGYRVVYGPPSVVQDRNEHDLTKDMRQEYLGYELNLEIVEAVGKADTDAVLGKLPERSLAAFNQYKKHFE